MYCTALYAEKRLFMKFNHEEMGCICFENPEMGICFITDPDGYWLEIIPSKK